MASHTWIVITEWSSLMEVIGVYDPLREHLIKMMVVLFRVLYRWDFESEEAQADLLMFEKLVPSFIRWWKIYFGKNKKRNYYHWLEVEALQVIFLFFLFADFLNDFKHVNVF